MSETRQPAEHSLLETGTPVLFRVVDRPEIRKKFARKYETQNLAFAVVENSKKNQQPSIRL